MINTSTLSIIFPTNTHTNPGKHLIVESLSGPSNPKSPRRDETQTKVQEDEKPPPAADPITKILQTTLNTNEQVFPESETPGLLGPPVVKYDVVSHVGSFIISNDRLGVNSQCNFGSVRATSCVFKGKWQYEVQLGSNGVMQVGWATLETKFSQEKGVGDTIDSYAYDGNRLRKWNKSTAQYGETWQAGDIIGCCIDLEEGVIEFIRNGKSLGIAFKNIQRGQNIAYFPAVSLAYQENIVANFGGTPLQFPVGGYIPLQSQKTSDNSKAQKLLTYLENALNLEPDNPTVMLSMNRIFENLGPYLNNGFVVEQAFFPFFARVVGLPEKISHGDSVGVVGGGRVCRLLDAMWAFLEETEMKACLERLTILLLNQFRSNSLSLEYPFQKYSLICLIALVTHRKTRRHLLRNLLFDRASRLMHFLHVRPMDETVLKEIIPHTWWEGCGNNNQKEYEASIKKIQVAVEDLQNLQVMFLTLLLTNTDGTEKRPSSRAIFLKKFRNHVRDVIRPGSVLHQQVQKALCTFFIFLKTIKSLQPTPTTPFPSLPPSMFYDTSINYHDMERIGGLSSYLYKTYHTQISTKLSIPDYITAPSPTTTQTTPMTQPRHLPGIIRVSTSDTIAQIEIIRPNRDAGTSTQPQTQPQPHPPSTTSSTTTTQEPHTNTLITGTPSGHNMLLPMLNYRSLDNTFTLYPGGFFASIDNRHNPTLNQPNNPAVALLGKEVGQVDEVYSLRELLDDAVIVFVSGVVANVEKITTLLKQMENYKKSLQKLTQTDPQQKEQSLSIKIFQEKLEEQSRHMAWVTAAVFTKERQRLAYDLLKTILTTLTEASNEGVLFGFVPEHYVTTLVNLNWFIISQMHPTVDFRELQDLHTTLPRISTFISRHFADPRIIIAEVKDTLTQALTSFICHETMLREGLEKMEESDQESMMRAILRPYENRAWAQSNWMLVRIWQGDGFGFQFPNSFEARRSFRAKPVQDEFGISTDSAPCPSKPLQNHVKNVLLQDQKFAVQYVHSVLNQLNWAFSEFVGLLQEIQTASSRPERVFIESRQLKICCTCFELTQALLRVMEMVVSLALPVLTDFKGRENSEPLLARLCMLLSQVLNRISSSTGCFANVMELDIIGLENVTYFPILSAVGGILVAMVRGEIGDVEDEKPATKTLLTEPSFQLNSLDFGKVQQDRFSLWNHPSDITQEELSTLSATLNHLTEWNEKLLKSNDLDSDLDEDSVCTICYAYSKNCTIKPCGHRTCKTCILHHLMNRGECFFCKAVIQQVYLDDGSKIHDIQS